jgi:CRISPR-associated protein Csm1
MNERMLYAVAGLLHDIGKFGQRADIGFYSSDDLSQQSKEIAESLCNKSQSGYYTHQHVIWTNNFLERFKNIFQQADMYGSGVNNLFNLASYHHRPSTKEQAIITLADHWSSGIDRNTPMAVEKVERAGKDKFRAIPMVSVFNELQTPQNINGVDVAQYGFDVTKLSIGESTLPQKIASLNIRESYTKLYKEFEESFSNIHCSTQQSLVETIYHQLKLYTSNIPASTMDYPNSSLFEHMKITGAFADCIAEYGNENPEALVYQNGGRVTIQKDHYPVMLLCGDISGIQRFIYNISNKSAMKGLKGRSFYVQILAEALSKELLTKTGATIINTVYAAGGKFYVLLPNTKKINDAIQLFNLNIQKELWKEHKGKLSLNIGKVPFRMENVSGGLKVYTPNNDKYYEVGELWKLVGEKTAEAKKNRFDAIVETEFEQMFKPFGEGGDVNICSVTGEEIQKNETVNLDIDDIEQGDTSNVVSKTVNTQIKIGNALYGAEYLVKYNEDKKDGFTIPGCGNWDVLQKKEHFHSIQNIIKLNHNKNDIHLNTDVKLENSTGIGFKFYGGVQMATAKGKILTLEELCYNEKNNTTDKLGVLRMDVDFLGQLFMSGFDKETASFSKLATMSASLEQFFSGYVNTLLLKPQYVNHVNIVYSGGDDLFAVGRWDQLLEFGIEIRKKFRELVCDRTDITLSAGLAIVGAKFPIAKAALIAEDAEKNAKNYKWQNKEKDAINLFGISLNWQEEIPFVLACKKDLIEWLDKDCISKGLLMKMFDFYSLYKKNLPDWKWQSTYTLSRFQKNAKNNDSKEAIELLKNLLFTGNYKNQFAAIRLDAFIVACRWAELIYQK